MVFTCCREIFSRKMLEHQLAGDLCSVDISKPGLNSWTHMAILNVVVCALAVVLCGKNVCHVVDNCLQQDEFLKIFFNGFFFFHFKGPVLHPYSDLYFFFKSQTPVHQSGTISYPKTP